MNLTNSEMKDHIVMNIAEVKVDTHVDILGSAISDLASKLEKPVKRAYSMQKVWEKINSEPWSYAIIGAGVVGGIYAFLKIKNKQNHIDQRRHYELPY